MLQLSVFYLAATKRGPQITVLRNILGRIVGEDNHIPGQFGSQKVKSLYAEARVP